MTDNNLLLLAAKACGLQVIFVTEDGRGLRVADMEDEWNPLTDDGDALRLAVRLGIALDRSGNRCWTFAGGMAIDGVCEEFYKDDPYLATRRAIVRSAAEIGRAMA